MRNLLTLLFVILSNLSFSQDKELFDFINQYRKSNNVKEIKWSNKLSDISVNQTKNMIKLDSLFHSGTNTYENVAGSSKWVTPITPTSLSEFNKFLKKHFNLVFNPDKVNNNELNKFIKLHIIYSWSKSTEHNKIMLKNDVKFGSVDVIIGDFTFKSNKKMVLGEEIIFKGMTSHFKGTTYATLNLD